MATPRIFISSTFFDLKQLRSDSVRFVQELGYEAITNERGNIPYGSDERLEEYCYKEIEHADVLVAIIGGRYGTGSDKMPYSISNVELKTALELGKQVYIFVEDSVNSEYYTYLENLENQDVDAKKIRYRFVDDTRVYDFLKEVHALPRNNAIATFKDSEDIASYLRQQWAGLFQRFLQEATLLKEIDRINEIQATTKTLRQLVDYLVADKEKGNEAIQEILTINHPMLQQIAKLLGVPYRVLFTNRKEMASWLKARGFMPTDEEAWDAPDYEEWHRTQGHKYTYISVYKKIFTKDGRLNVYTSEQWNPTWLTIEGHTLPKPEDFISDEAKLSTTVDDKSPTPSPRLVIRRALTPNASSLKQDADSIDDSNPFVGQ